MVDRKYRCLRESDFYSNAQGSTLWKWNKVAENLGYERISDMIFCESEICTLSEMSKKLGFSKGVIRLKMRILGAETKNMSHKMSYDDIIGIKKAHKKEYRPGALARKLGFSYRSIYEVRTGRRHKNVV